MRYLAHQLGTREAQSVINSGSRMMLPGFMPQPIRIRREIQGMPRLSAVGMMPTMPEWGDQAPMGLMVQPQMPARRVRNSRKNKADCDPLISVDEVKTALMVKPRITGLASLKLKSVEMNKKLGKGQRRGKKRGSYMKRVVRKKPQAFQL